jgi:PPM family protein phosphatase
LRFETAGISNKGGRDKNEDYIGYMEESGEYGCWIVADGLGGHNGGEMASKFAVDSFLKSFSSTPTISEEGILEHIKQAQNLILCEQKKQQRLSQMRTTIVILAYNNKEAIWAHLGDSRLYYFSKKKLALQTKDHSVSQYAVDIKDITMMEIRYHEDRNKLLKVLGTEGSLKPSILQPPIRVKPGDAFLLCTDGFWEYVYEVEMEQDLEAAKCVENWLENMMRRHKSRATMDCDNYSALCILAY